MLFLKYHNILSAPFASRRCAEPKGQRFCLCVRSEDEAILLQWAATRRGERRFWQRAQVVLASASGKTVAAISAQTGLTPQTVFA